MMLMMMMKKKNEREKKQLEEQRRQRQTKHKPMSMLYSNCNGIIIIMYVSIFYTNEISIYLYM